MKTTFKVPAIELAGTMPTAWMAIVVTMGIAALAAHGQSLLTITCPTNRTVECGATWAFETPTVTDNCSGSNVVISVLTTVTNGLCGQTFMATRTWLATDACGTSNTCAQTVTVVDTTPPRLVCPSNLVVAATSSSGVVVNFIVTAGDDCDPNPTITPTPPSGSVFPLGTNYVVCRALDGCSNESRCSFTITVVPVPRVISVGSANGRTIGLRFDMEVDQVSAETVTNYTLYPDAGNHSNAVLRPNLREVELTLGQPLPAQASFSVTISNLWATGQPAPGTNFPQPTTNFSIANGQASGRVLRFNTVAFGDPGDRSDVFTCDNQALEFTGGGGTAWFPTSGVDHVTFSYRTLTGDFDVAARMGNPPLGYSNALGGLMMRDSLSSTSRMAALVFDAAQAKAIWLVRSNDGGAAQVQGEVPFNTNLCWLRLRRVGDTLTAFASTNGTDWPPIGLINEYNQPAIGIAVGSSQAGEAASMIIERFQYRNYYLQLIPMPSGFGFSWYGPGRVEETSAIMPSDVIAGWQTSAVPVQQNADERWVIFVPNTPPFFTSRFFRVIADP